MSSQYLLTVLMMVFTRDNHQAVVLIPAETFMEVVGPVENDDRYLLVDVDRGQFHIFASDLAGRSIPVVNGETTNSVREESRAVERKTRGRNRTLFQRRPQDVQRAKGRVLRAEMR